MSIRDLFFKESKITEVKPKERFRYSKFSCVLIDPIDSLINFDEYFKTLIFNTLDNVNIKHDDNFIHSSLYLSIYDIINRYKRLSIEIKLYIEIINKLKNELCNTKDFDKLSSYEDVVTTLKSLKFNGVELITLTSLPSSFLRLAYQKFDYNRFFDTILSDNKFLDKQSKIDNVIQFNRLFDYNPSEILVVGNSSYCSDVVNRLNASSFCLSRSDGCESSYQQKRIFNSLDYIKNNW